MRKMVEICDRCKDRIAKVKCDMCNGKFCSSCVKGFFLHEGDFGNIFMIRTANPFYEEKSGKSEAICFSCLDKFKRDIKLFTETSLDLETQKKVKIDIIKYIMKKIGKIKPKILAEKI